MPLGVHKIAMFAASAGGDNLVLLSTTVITTATANVTITSDINAVYKEYIFGFYNVNPTNDGNTFQWQMKAVGGSTYDQTLHSVHWRGAHYENNSNAFFGNNTSFDNNNATTFSNLGENQGGDADESLDGLLHIWEPASTTYAKYFMSRVMEHANSNGPFDYFTAGYVNTTSALDGIRFQFSGGNIDNAVIKMWGAK